MEVKPGDVSPCGRWVVFDPADRQLKIDRFGVVKERARPDRVFVDLDLPQRFHIARRRARGRRLDLATARGLCPIRVVRAVCSRIGLHPTSVRYDRTARGFHVVVQLPWSERLPRAETVALQCCFGSDDRRESLNLARARSIRQFGAPRAMLDRWNLLFERKL